jgi:hypothetical protein
MKILLALICAALACAIIWQSRPAFPAPVAIANNEGVTITLTDEPCALAAVSNLKYRAIWSEPGTRFDGCFGVSGPVVILYFDDRTVVVLPVRAFSLAQGV